METLKRTFFEDPFYVYVTLAVAELILAILWHQRRDRRLALALLGPLLLAGGVFTLERLVVTDREQIIANADQVVALIGSGRLPEVAPYLTDDFTGYFKDRATALAAGQAAIKTFGISHVEITQAKVEFEGGMGVMNATTRIECSTDLGSGKVPLSWVIYWTKRSGRWQIAEVMEPKSSWGDLKGMQP